MGVWELSPGPVIHDEAEGAVSYLDYVTSKANEAKSHLPPPARSGRRSRFTGHSALGPACLVTPPCPV